MNTDYVLPVEGSENGLAITAISGTRVMVSSLRRDLPSDGALHHSEPVIVAGHPYFVNYSHVVWDANAGTWIADGAPDIYRRTDAYFGKAPAPRSRAYKVELALVEAVNTWAAAHVEELAAAEVKDRDWQAHLAQRELDEALEERSSAEARAAEAGHIVELVANGFSFSEAKAALANFDQDVAGVTA